jgi:hypothetical protein
MADKSGFVFGDVFVAHGRQLEPQGCCAIGNQDMLSRCDTPKFFECANSVRDRGTLKAKSERNMDWQLAAYHWLGTNCIEACSHGGGIKANLADNSCLM